MDPLAVLKRLKGRDFERARSGVSIALRSSVQIRLFLERASPVADEAAGGWDGSRTPEGEEELLESLLGRLHAVLRRPPGPLFSRGGEIRTSSLRQTGR